MSISKILFSFSGRIPRQTYWLALLGISAACFVLTVIFEELSAVLKEGDSFAGSVAMLLVMFMYPVMLWCTLAVNVKRLHDRGRPGIWILLLALPGGQFWIMLELGFLAGTQGPNEFDDSFELAVGDQVPSAPQIAGRQCVDCQQKIVSFIGAKLCAECNEPMHTACSRKHVASAHGTPAHAAYS